MPAVKLYGVDDELWGQIEASLEQALLPNRRLYDEVVVNRIESEVRDLNRNPAPYAEIHVSQDTSDEDLRSVYRVLVCLIDVELYLQNRSMVFQTKEE